MKSLLRCGFAIVLAFAAVLGASAQPVPLGAGSYFLAPKAGDKPPPQAPLRTAAMLAQAAPTNQWYSALIFNPKPDPIFAHPLTVKTTAAGIEMGLPTKTVLPTDRGDAATGVGHFP